MIRAVIAILVVVGATFASSEKESELGPTENPENVPLPPENVPLIPEDIPLAAGNVPPPGYVPLNPNSEDPLTQDGLVPVEFTEEPSKDGSKIEGTDLKTDATFWWPFYRSFYRYPYYRHYRPRVYRYYYW